MDAAAEDDPSPPPGLDDAMAMIVDALAKAAERAGWTADAGVCLEWHEGAPAAGIPFESLDAMADGTFVCEACKEPRAVGEAVDADQVWPGVREVYVAVEEGARRHDYTLELMLDRAYGGNGFGEFLRYRLPPTLPAVCIDCAVLRAAAEAGF